MFSYIGSKNSELKHLRLPALVDSYAVVEPFGGSGAVSMHLQKKYGCKIHINDLSPHTYTYYHMMACDNDETIMEFDRYCSNVFDEIVAGRQPSAKVSYDIMQQIHAIPDYLVRNHIISRMQMGSRRSMLILTSGEYKWRPFKYKRPDLMNTVFSNVDYKHILRHYENDVNAFVFLDPVYMNENSSVVDNSMYAHCEGTFSVNDYAFIIDWMKRAKCKSMLVAQDNDTLRELITGDTFTSYTYTKHCNINQKQNVYRVTQRLGED